MIIINQVNISIKKTTTEATESKVQFPFSFCSMRDDRETSAHKRSISYRACELRQHVACVHSRPQMPRALLYSNMAPRLSGHTSIFGAVFFESKSLLGIERLKKLQL